MYNVLLFDQLRRFFLHGCLFWLLITLNCSICFSPSDGSPGHDPGLFAYYFLQTFECCWLIAEHGQQERQRFVVAHVVRRVADVFCEGLLTSTGRQRDCGTNSKTKLHLEQEAADLVAVVAKYCKNIWIKVLSRPVVRLSLIREIMCIYCSI